MRTDKFFAILQQDELEILNTPTQIAVYLSIKSYCANGKRDYPLSIREIHKRSKVSIGWIKTTIQELISLSLIEIIGTEGHRGGLVNIYHIKRSPSEQVGVQSVNSKTISSVHPLSSSVQSLASNSHKVIKEVYKNIDTEEPIQEEKTKTSLPYKALIVEFNRRYSTNLFPTFGKQAKAIKVILQSYTESDIWACSEWLSKDQFWKQKGFDFSTIQSQLAKYKMTLQTSKPKEVYVNAKSV